MRQMRWLKKVQKQIQKTMKKYDKQENGTNFKGKNKEQDKHEENRWDDTEKNDIIDESQENAYRMEIGQKDNSGRNCKKCEVSFKKQEKFRKHLIRGHKKQMRTDVVMIYFI